MGRRDKKRTPSLRREMGRWVDSLGASYFPAGAPPRYTKKANLGVSGSLSPHQSRRVRMPGQMLPAQESFGSPRFKPVKFDGLKAWATYVMI